MELPDGYRWWQAGIIYQVYPRSFQDSDGDGVGDLRGILGRLDYLRVARRRRASGSRRSTPRRCATSATTSPTTARSTRSSARWRTSTSSSPRRTRAACASCSTSCPNHTSDQHPWFVESRAAATSPKRDWYIWRDPGPDGGPPNNWLAHFGGSALELRRPHGAVLLPRLPAEQPDLNWRNPEVQAAMFDVLRFWLDRGVDGFRVDVLWHIIKDAEFRDDPPNPDYVPDQGPYDSLLHVYSTDRPEVHEIVRRDARRARRRRGRAAAHRRDLPADRAARHLLRRELLRRAAAVQLPAHRAALGRAAHQARGRHVRGRCCPQGGWPNWVLGNHDHHRIASRIGHAQARVAAMMLLTLRGTPTMYYGDEIGMTDVPDPARPRAGPVRAATCPGLGLGRDPERTPMQWDDVAERGLHERASPGFRSPRTTTTLNVAVERDDPRSMLTLYRRLIELRRAEPALSVGAYTPLAAHGDVLRVPAPGGRRAASSSRSTSATTDQVYPLAPVRGRRHPLDAARPRRRAGARRAAPAAERGRRHRGAVAAAPSSSSASPSRRLGGRSAARYSG